MSISEKIEGINNKINQSKTRNNLYRQTVKISALSSGNVSRYDFLRCFPGVLPEKDLLEKAGTMKRFQITFRQRIKSTN